MTFLKRLLLTAACLSPLSTLADSVYWLNIDSYIDQKGEYGETFSLPTSDLDTCSRSMKLYMQQANVFSASCDVMPMNRKYYLRLLSSHQENRSEA